MGDKYDEQIERLTANPRAIRSEWFAGRGLFRFAGVEEEGEPAEDGIGCLTMIREEPDRYRAADDDLTRRILGDARLPDDPSKITPDHLPIFAEYQREMDRMWGRK